MMTHHSVMASSLRIEILKIGDFSCDIDYSTRTDVFRDVISFIINQSDPMRPKGASGGQCPPATERMQAKRACIIQLQTPKR